MADEALSVPDVLCSFIWRKVDFVYIHGIGIQSRGSVSQWDVAVSSFSEFPKSHYVPIEFPSFIKCCTRSARHGTLVLFFLFLFLPLTFAFVLTTVVVLCKPGCAVRAADTSSV